MWLLKLDRTPRLILLSIVLGIIGGFGAQLFLLLLHWGNVYILGFFGHYPTIHVAAAHAAGVAPKPFSHWYWWMPVSTTLGGLVVGFLIYGVAPETEGHGTDASLNAFHRNNGRMRARVPFVKTLASAITIGSGGSGGREGPTAQIASGAGAIFGQIFNLPDEERRTVVLIGMAAGLSAIFKSPLGTAIFAVEILYSRMAFEGGALIFTLISASVAYAVIGAFSGYTPLFLLPASTRVIHPLDLVWFGLLGILAGALGALMPAVYYRIRDWFAALRIPRYFKPAIGGLAVGLIGIAVPPIIGGGYGYMQFALQGGSGLAMGLLLLFSLGKIVTLSLTVGSGGSAGVFGPTLFIGTMLGASFAALLHLFHIHIDGSWLAVVGMAAVFAGTARVPIASMVMVIEMTSGFQLIMPTMLAVALAFIVQLTLTRHAKYPTIYEGQVSTPGDSPVYRDLYYETAAELLRRRQVSLDRDILTSELQHALDRGEGVPLRRRSEQLYSVNLLAGTPVAGREVRSLGLAEMRVLIVGLIRGESEIVPNGSTRLQVGDGLLVAATGDSIGEFRALIAPPQAAGEAPAGATKEDNAA
ncbi:MAG TPA: chloride channel protein [Gammaproteobacteria bacterium]|nr:chloride channel protein [Gammaproteobacteria bacterium]